MVYDAIVVGAGPGGLVCATNLVKSGYKVKVLERNFFYGGTSYIFNRQGYQFPMGPLGFSSPREVQQLLSELGITTEIEFTRRSYQLISPSFNILYSQPLQRLKADLLKLYEEETEGIEAFFTILENIIKAINHIQDWHPNYSINKIRNDQNHILSAIQKEAYRVINEYSQISAQNILDKYIVKDHLKWFLGSLGTGRPKMSMLLLAMMWNLMAEKGIWHPAGGIHGILDLLN
jgi:phytoene dehydrogenase-like protein